VAGSGLAPGLRYAVPDNQAEPIWNVWATFGPRGLPGDRLPAVRVYPVVSETSEAALELFIDRQMTELMVESWNRDEPDRAGELHVEPVELETSVN
jgi:hypothetical protein